MMVGGGCIRRFLSDEGSGGSGQALAEFAIIFPFQLFLTFGLMQLMLLMVSGLMVNYAAFMACRAEMVGGSGKDAAAIVLSPLSYHAITGSSDENKFIPGWGQLKGSGRALAKIEYDAEETDDVVSVHLTFKQELIFPFVDRLFAIMGGSGASSGEGRSFGSASESNGRVEVNNGHVHVLISRSHYLKRDSDIDVSSDSSTFDFEWN